MLGRATTQWVPLLGEDATHRHTQTDRDTHIPCHPEAINAGTLSLRKHSSRSLFSVHPMSMGGGNAVCATLTLMGWGREDGLSVLPCVCREDYGDPKLPTACLFRTGPIILYRNVLKTTLESFLNQRERSQLFLVGKTDKQNQSSSLVFGVTNSLLQWITCNLRQCRPKV